MKRILAGILFLTMLNAGCQSLDRAKPKAEATGRWNEVRSRVKLQLAEQQFNAGQFQAAVTTATEAVALDPTKPQSYVLLARGHIELNQPLPAMQALAAADRAGASSAELHYTRGVLHELRGDYAEALKAYEAAHGLKPDELEYLAARAECLTALDRASEAASLIEAAAGSPSDDGTLAALAIYIGATGSGPATTSSGQRMLSRQSGVLAEELGRRLAQSGRCREALSILQPLLDASAQAESSGAVRRAAAACHLSLGDAEQAKATLADYARTHEDDSLANLMLAKAAVATDDIPTALRAVDLVQLREPNRPDLWLVRATVQWKRGNLRAAASDLSDVLRVLPDDLDAHCLLAEVYRAQRRFDAARDQFRRALAIDPACSWALAGLAALENEGPGQAGEPAEAKLTAAETAILPSGQSASSSP